MAQEHSPRKVATIDCSGEPNYPEATARDWYIVSVAGKIGGASGTAVGEGAVLRCTADAASGTQAAVGSKWSIEQSTAENGGDITFIGSDSAHVITVEQPTEDDVVGGTIRIIAGSPTAGSAEVGGDLQLTGGASENSGNGGTVSITGGAGPETAGSGGSVTITTGTAPVDGSPGIVTITSVVGATGTSTTTAGESGGINLGTGAGGPKTGTGTADGGASGATAITSGNGGATAATSGGTGGAAANITITGGNGGAASAGTSNGGRGASIVLLGGTGGTSAGGTAGLNGAIFHRSPVFRKGAAAAMTDTATISAANILNGHIAGTPTAAADYTFPTGTVLSAACPTTLAVGDSLEFAISNLATNDTYDITVVTAAGGITFKFSNVLIEANSATTKINWGRFRCVNTGTNTWDIYRVG